MSNFSEEDFMDDIGAQFMGGNPVRNSRRASYDERAENKEIDDLEERMEELVERGTQTTNPYELLEIAAEYGEIDETLEDMLGSYEYGSGW